MEAVWEVADLLPQYVSKTMGSEISGVRLFCSLLYVYPISIVQRLLLTGANPNLHHIYHALTAAFLLYFNFGVSSGLFFINVLLVYLLLLVLQPSKLTVILSLTVNMAYLSYGYAQKYFSEETDYLINWTTPHCVLTLKLIGLTWDVYDGAQKDRKGKEETAVASAPTFLEVLGFSYYPPGLMTGPQISFMKYRRFTAGEFDEYLHSSSSWSYGSLRLLLGIILIVAYPLLSPYIPVQFFYTEQFKGLLFPVKFAYMAAWGQIILCRYLGVWLVAEGSCAFSGIAFNGKDSDGKLRWNDCANIKLRRFITSTCSNHYVESFNINTNKWVLTYVYKRLRFLNNRHISQGATLVFLAVWHGFGSGYFVCFFLEFIIINGEKQIAELCSKKKWLNYLVNLPVLGEFSTLLTKLVSTFTMGYALVSFEQLRFGSYMEVYGNVHYATHIFYLTWPLLYLLLNKTLQDVTPRADKPRADKPRADKEL